MPPEVPLPLAPRLQVVHLASVEVTKLKNNKTQTTRAVPRLLACSRRPSGCGPPPLPHKHFRRAIRAELGAAPLVSETIPCNCAVALLSPRKEFLRARYSTVTKGSHLALQWSIDTELSLALKKQSDPRAGNVILGGTPVKDVHAICSKSSIASCVLVSGRAATVL